MVDHERNRKNATKISGKWSYEGYHPKVTLSSDCSHSVAMRPPGAGTLSKSAAPGGTVQLLDIDVYLVAGERDLQVLPVGAAHLAAGERVQLEEHQEVAIRVVEGAEGGRLFK